MRNDTLWLGIIGILGFLVRSWHAERVAKRERVWAKEDAEALRINTAQKAAELRQHIDEKIEPNTKITEEIATKLVTDHIQDDTVRFGSQDDVLDKISRTQDEINRALQGGGSSDG